MTADLVAEAVATYTANVSPALLYRDYHEGRHRLDFASPRFRKSWSWVMRTAIENLCPAVVSAYVDRISIEDFGGDNERAEQLGLQRLANFVHTEAHVTGNAFAITWLNRDGQPYATFHRAEQVAPLVDAEAPDTLRSLAKLWVDDDGFGRATVYDREKLSRWVSTSKVTRGRRQSGLTAPNHYPADANQWVAYDTDDAPHEEPHDFGVVPAVWWKRNAPTQFDPGVSILRDLISPQDRLNKVNADHVISSERIALPIRYVLDVAEDTLRGKFNPQTGRVDQPSTPLDDAVNSLLTLSAKGPAGQFDGPNAADLVKIKQELEGEIARISGVPVYYLAQTTGDIPSGMSLNVLTSRLTSAVSTFQQDAAAPWRGQLELLGFDNPSIAWADTSPVDEAEALANAEAKQRLGYALEDILEGLDEPNREEVLRRAQESANQQAATIGRALASGRTPAGYPMG